MPKFIQVVAALYVLMMAVALIACVISPDFREAAHYFFAKPI